MPRRQPGVLSPLGELRACRRSTHRSSTGPHQGRRSTPPGSFSAAGEAGAGENCVTWGPAALAWRQAAREAHAGSRGWAGTVHAGLLLRKLAAAPAQMQAGRGEPRAPFERHGAALVAAAGAALRAVAGLPRASAPSPACVTCGRGCWDLHFPRQQQHDRNQRVAEACGRDGVLERQCGLWGCSSGAIAGPGAQAGAGEDGAWLS